MVAKRDDPNPGTKIHPDAGTETDPGMEIRPDLGME